MTLLAAASLFLATFLFAITPGPGTLALMSRGLVLGMWPAFILGIGLTLGDMLYLWAAMLSLGFIAEQAETAFQWVRWLGGAYLIVLGIQTFRSPPPQIKDEHNPLRGWWKSLIAGCAISCTNPKVILFYLGFLPLFLDLKTLSLADMLSVTATVLSALLIALFAMSLGAHQLRPLLTKGSIGRWINRVAGGLMASVGIVVARS